MGTDFILDEKMLEKAGRAVKEKLCSHCLGRLFAKVGTGYTNLERGEHIHNELKSLPGSIPGPSKCSVCQGLFDELQDFVRLVTEASKDYEFETFLIGTKVDSEVMEAEENLWGRLEVETQEPIKGELNREIGKVLEQRLGKEVDFGNPHVTFVVDTRYNNIETTIKPLHVYGRYRKLKRGIPQTKWFCRKCRGYGCEYCNNTGKMYPTSVEELVGAPLLEAARGESHSFHGMGREDIDALMLGNGRPFVLEISNPRKRTLDLEGIMNKINEDNKEVIEIEGFEYSDPATVRRIKSERSRKTYRVGIEFESEPDKEKVFKVANNFRNLQIQQQTPKRVSHRRANLKRNRTVHSFEVLDLAEKNATVEIIGESGLYIKELIHGDEGRTNPSFSAELGIDCTVKSLDVVHIWDIEEPNGSNYGIKDSVVSSSAGKQRRRSGRQTSGFDNETEETGDE